MWVDDQSDSTMLHHVLSVVEILLVEAEAVVEVAVVDLVVDVVVSEIVEVVEVVEAALTVGALVTSRARNRSSEGYVPHYRGMSEFLKCSTFNTPCYLLACGLSVLWVVGS